MNGYLFEVKVKDLTGGGVSKEQFYVAASSEEVARQRLSDSKVLTDEIVTLLRVLNSSEVAGLKLANGEVREVTVDPQ
ncbi:hypothetical protein [Ruegeria meonggei]|uniref:hypothetical protein n=1 Tax=Ruegeria meonggei TaxID=1446476 RepID=UPI003673357E